MMLRSWYTVSYTNVPHTCWDIWRTSNPTTCKTIKRPWCLPSGFVQFARQTHTRCYLWAWLTEEHFGLPYLCHWTCNMPSSKEFDWLFSFEQTLLGTKSLRPPSLNTTFLLLVSNINFVTVTISVSERVPQITIPTGSKMVWNPIALWPVDFCWALRLLWRLKLAITLGFFWLFLNFTFHFGNHSRNDAFLNFRLFNHN